MADEVLGGYRLVRRLGEGQRADVFLGHPLRPSAGGQQVAVKIFHSDVTEGAIAAEIDALVSAEGPHVVRLIDLASAETNRTVMLLERLGPRTLADLVRLRPAFEAGEATTILVPLARAIERMHRAGVSHGSIVPASILFSDEGAPVIGRFGRAAKTEATTRAERERVPEFTADLLAFRAVAGLILEGAEFDLVREWLESETLDDGWSEHLATMMFRLGPAAPVTFDPPAAPTLDAHPSAGGPARRRDLHHALPSNRAGALLARGLDRARELAAPIRTRFWVIGAAAVVTLVSAIVLVPEQSTDATAERAPTPAATTPVVPDPDSVLVQGDDPLAAIDVLLSAREECLRAASILCLDAVDQSNSAAMEDDVAAVRGIQSGAEPQGEDRQFPEPRGLELAERLGGAALVVVTAADGEPASILMIRSEAGWRIRDYVE